MKLMTLCTLVLMLAVSANAAVLVDETFTYADGSLVGNGAWANHSGTAGDLLVSGGVAVVQHGTPSEDANVLFTPTTGVVYFSFDFMVPDLGTPWAGTDCEYFAHLMPETGYTYMARVDIDPPAGSGDFTVGIATGSSTAEALWATDLAYGTWYHLVAAYDQDLNIATLWIDPSGYDSVSIQGSDNDDPGVEMARFALRQSDSSMNEGIHVDNLLVAGACEDVFDSNCPSVANENANWGAVKSLYR